MDAQTSELLNKMLDFLNYNPDQTKFNLFSEDISLHYELKNFIEYVNSFDQNGMIAVSYLSDVCRKVIENSTVKIVDVIRHPKCISKFEEMYHTIYSKQVYDVNRKMINGIIRFFADYDDRKLIGSENTIDFEKDLIKSVRAIVNEFKKLKFEVYMKSGMPVGRIEKFSPDIQVFGSLSQCILTLEKANDGIGICYIRNSGLDGYFGFFVKSNGNLFSLNERLDEKYVGQHGRLRNGRYAEDKALELFPYDEICKFSGEDYKGYSTDIDIDQNKLNIFEVGKEEKSVCIRMILSMLAIASKYMNFKIDQDEVMIDSLISTNLKKIGTEALVKYEQSQIIKKESDFTINFDKDKLLNGDYDAEFDNTNENRNYMENGHFKGYNQKLVEIYGKDFEFNNEELLNTDSSMRLIGDGEHNQEFIGSRKRMELLAYYNLRKKLAIHIRQKMKQEFDDFGGIDCLVDWYRQKLLNIKEKLYRLCLEAYNNHGEDKNYLFGPEDSFVRNAMGSPITYDFRSQITVTDQNGVYERIWFNRYCKKMLITPFEENGYRIKKFICPITFNKASVFFVFRFYKWTQIEDLIDCDLPNFCKEWYGGGMSSSRYNGNCLLDVTDEVGEIDVSKISNSFDFSFALTFSKSGLIKLEKQHAIESKIQ